MSSHLSRYSLNKEGAADEERSVRQLEKLGSINSALAKAKMSKARTNDAIVMKHVTQSSTKSKVVSKMDFSKKA